MIGGSRQSVNRLLADLADQGLVRFERDVLVVVRRRAASPHASSGDATATDRAGRARPAAATVRDAALRAAVALRVEAAGRLAPAGRGRRSSARSSRRPPRCSTPRPPRSRCTIRRPTGSSSRSRPASQGQGVVGLAIEPAEGVAGYVFTTGQPLALSDVAARRRASAARSPSRPATCRAR